MSLSSLVVPGLLAAVALAGLGRRVDVYAALTHGAEHQQHRRSVVVHRHGGFRAGEAAEKPLYMAVARAPAAAFQVVFQGGVLGGGSHGGGSGPF